MYDLFLTSLHTDFTTKTSTSEYSGGTRNLFPTSYLPMTSVCVVPRVIEHVRMGMSIVLLQGQAPLNATILVCFCTVCVLLVIKEGFSVLTEGH